MEAYLPETTAVTHTSDSGGVVLFNRCKHFQSHGNSLKVVVPASLTGNNYGLYQIEMEAGARGPKLHYHKLMDETFIINEGTLTVLTASGEIEAKAGTVIHVPRFLPHGYNNNSDAGVKMTMIFNPGLNREIFFEKMYQMLDENPDDLAAFQKLYLENDSYPLDDNNMIPMKGAIQAGNS